MTDLTAADLARLDALRAEGAAVTALVATVRELARAIVATDDHLSCFWCDYVYGEEHHPDGIVRRARALLDDEEGG